MLTNVAGKWLDPDQVVMVTPDLEDTCKVFFHHDSVPLYLDATADVVAALVNNAHVKANIRLLDRKVEDEYACSACGGSGLVADQAERDRDADQAEYTRFEAGRQAGREHGFRLGLCYALLQRDGAVKAGGGYLTLVDAYGSIFKEIETRAIATSESIAESIQEAERWRLDHMAQVLAAGLDTKPLMQPDTPDPSDTTPEAAKPVTEHADASTQGFLWAVAWLEDRLQVGIDLGMTPVQINTALIQELHGVQADQMNLEDALITGKALCDQKERDGDERD